MTLVKVLSDNLDAADSSCVTDGWTDKLPIAKLLSRIIRFIRRNNVVPCNAGGGNRCHTVWLYASDVLDAVFNMAVLPLYWYLF